MLALVVVAWPRRACRDTWLIHFSSGEHDMFPKSTEKLTWWCCGMQHMRSGYMQDSIPLHVWSHRPPWAFIDINCTLRCCRELLMCVHDKWSNVTIDMTPHTPHAYAVSRPDEASVCINCTLRWCWVFVMWVRDKWSDVMTDSSLYSIIIKVGGTLCIQWCPIKALVIWDLQLWEF